MKKVAVIGGAGFIGTRLIDRLSERNDIQFGVLDILESEKYPDMSIKTDIRDINSLRLSLAGYDVVINLAAEHKDNVSPVSRYYDTNVSGQSNLCRVMDELGIQHLIFTSSVAVYGFVKQDTGEDGQIAPFHEYGDSKFKAELEGEAWFEEGKCFSVVRPTVVFGENNRGNVYNLLRQIALGQFLMIGSGTNQKSMAYVENIAAFLEYLIDHGRGHQIFNFVDKPDFNMNELVSLVNVSLGKSKRVYKIPYFIGIVGGFCFDLLAKVISKELPVSSIRVKKFCSRTQFRTNTDYLGFTPPVSLAEGLGSTVQNEFFRKKTSSGDELGRSPTVSR